MSEAEGKIYASPKTDDNSKNHWVPIVVKNKDVLVGYVEAVTMSSDIYSISPSELMHQLCSERFNDVMRNGKRLSDMTLNEKYNYFRELISQTILREKHPENEDGILTDYSLGISCSCGNFYGFEKLEDLPEENLKCQVCDKTIIHYTSDEDSDYLYDGELQDQEELAAIIDTINEELGIEVEFDESDFEDFEDDEEDEDEGDLF